MWCFSTDFLKRPQFHWEPRLYMRVDWQKTNWHHEGNRHFPRLMRTRIQLCLCYYDGSRNSSVSVVARLRAGKDNWFFSSPYLQDPLWDPTSFLLNGNLRVKRPGHEADLSAHVLSRSCNFLPTHFHVRAQGRVHLSWHDVRVTFQRPFRWRV
jgi:hypothetical protein